MMFSINNNLEPVEKMKRAREGAPWTEEEIRHPAAPGAEHFWDTFSFEPRTMSQIKYMQDVFCDIISYNRHLVMKHRMEQGLDMVDPEIWARAQEAAERLRQKYGENNLGPYSDFEWGMLNGKLSALRWVLGCEWDDLDT